LFNKIIQKMTKYFSKVIKIPKQISLYFFKNSILVFYNPLGFKTIKLKSSAVFLNEKNSLVLLKKFKNKSIFNKSVLNKTYESLIIKTYKSILNYYKKKLLLVGVGYKLMIIKTDNTVFLECKLGFSHSVYVNIPANVTIVVPKPSKIYILSQDYLAVSQLSALLKSLKSPDSYKGKGFRYDNEKLVLKVGKKI